MMRTFSRGLSPILLLAGVAACNSDAAGPPPIVRYVLDAPFCGGRYPVLLLIDNVQIATDTFSINVAPPVHTTSSDYTTTIGPHTIGARLVQGYVWPNRSVTLAPGQVFTDTLSFYCS